MQGPRAIVRRHRRHSRAPAAARMATEMRRPRQRSSSAQRRSTGSSLTGLPLTREEAQMVANERDHLRAVPFGRSDLAADLAPVTIDQQCRRDADGIERARYLAGLVDIDIERFETELLVEVPDDRDALTVDGERQDEKLGFVDRRLEPVERRHLLAAGDTPGRPDIEKDRPPAEIGERQGVILTVDEAKLGQRSRLIEEGKAEGFGGG